MSIHVLLRQLDARYRFPRPANALHLDAYQAAFRVLCDSGEGLAIVLSSIVTCFCLAAIGRLVEASPQSWLYFYMGMALAVLIALAEASSLVLPY
jgi:integral membrane sensor domain MASE1